MTSRAALLVMAILPLACGGGGSSTAVGPTTTPTPTPTTTTLPAAPAAPVFRDGWTGATIAASITPASPGLQAPVTVTAGGYLVREQLFDGRPIALWPSTQEYVDELVYGWGFESGPRLVRWPAPFTVTLDTPLAQDGEVIAKVQEVLAEIARSTGLLHRLGPNGQVTIKIDQRVEDDDAVATTALRVRGGTITGADVKFRTQTEITGLGDARYDNTLLHEMGHVIGLSHSLSVRDVMTPGSGPGTRVAQFQNDESICLKLMYVHRLGGNLPPDRAPAPGAFSGREEAVVVVDR